MITVLTPSYNRGSLLRNLYQSLLKQDYKDFEWVIIDDGSIDDTESVVKNLSQEQKIIISYFKQSNGGKHRAINRGVKEAKGILIFIVDSDDTLPENSLSIINKYYLEVKEDPSFAGICGRMAHHDGKIIGQADIFKPTDMSSIEMRYKYGFKGDMCEVFKADILRKYPFPEIDNERFCPEAMVWNRIAKAYRLRFFNKVVYFRDYIEGGLTSKIVRIRMNSPIASMMCYAEMNQLNIPFKDKIKAAINYWRFRLCYQGTGEYPKLFSYWNLFAPIGWLMHINDLRMNKKSS